MIKTIRIVCTLCCLLIGNSAYSQWYDKLDDKVDSLLAKDSLHFSNRKFINNIFQQAVNSIKRNPFDTSNMYLNGKAEAPYRRYEGKIIRHIQIEALDFEQSFNDTTKRNKSWASRLGDAFHTNTKEFVVRNSLFIKENTPVNAYKIADNERYLRTLNFIHDARIIIKPIKGNKDSVDVLVITKDFFTLSAGASSSGLNHIKTQVRDANIAGLGQSIELNSLYDYNRRPYFGYGGIYRINNISKTFINATAIYNTANVNNTTRTEETTATLIFDKPLVSPYSKFAGGLQLAHNAAENRYVVFPDSTVFQYKYNVFDTWLGYNLAINKLTATNNGIRDRRFIAMRYLNYNFDQKPFQTGDRFDPVFNSREAVLGQITFFRQDYYKTQYIYGFGTTEDLPYGYNIAITGGWYKQEGREAPYAGVSASRYIATNGGDFAQLYLRTGGFLYDKNIQDGSFLLGFSGYGRIVFWNTTKIRPYIMMSYSQIHNRTFFGPLRLNTPYGPRGFISDSAYGDKRVTVQAEAEFYLKRTILGFKFAPFPYADATLLTPEGRPFTKSSLYTSLGGGIRARNENLIFETIEARAYYFPVAPAGMKGFKVIINANIRFRYISNFIVPPDVVLLNSEQ